MAHNGGGSARRSSCRQTCGGVEMAKNGYMVIFFVLMIGCIVGMDVLFFSHHFVARLIANIAVVLAFAAVYFVFLKDM
jgi:hypothetical protein